MATPTDADRGPKAPPPWLLPALVAGLVIAAAALAFVITTRPATTTAPAMQAPAAQGALDQPLDQQQAPVAQGADGQSAAGQDASDSMPAGHGSLDPNGPKVEVVTLADAKAHLDAGTAVFIDVRAGSDYAAGHIPGALTITSQELEGKIQSMPAGSVVIAYGDADRPDSGQRGAQIFMELGYPTVIALDGGFQGWRDAGYPVATVQ